MITVTGGAGFIGSALVWALNERGIDDILIVDHLGSSEKWKNLRGLSFDDYIEKDDFIERVRGDGALPDITAILHMGACSATTELDCSYLVHNNFEYTKELARYALLKDIRFVYASSAATYGDGAQAFGDDEGLLAGLLPLNMYGYSKQIFDLWAYKRGMLNKIVGLKYFNVFGPNEYHKGDMRSFVIKGFEQIQAQGRLSLFKSGNPAYADGQQMRDFLYVKDAAAITLFFLDHPELGGIYNVGSGKARTWIDLALAIFAASGKQPAIEFVDMPRILTDKYQYFTQADMGKLRQAGYTQPITTLEEAIRDYVSNYLMPGGYLTSNSGMHAG